MPAIKYYIVTQEREVKVCATNEIEAAQIATNEFNGSSHMEETRQGVRSSVEVLDLTIRKDY